jgi:TIR domain
MDCLDTGRGWVQGNYQAWHFRPGQNFVLEMERAATGADRIIAVLSQDYLNAAFTQSEWAAAFALDPKGKERKLIPIRVKECKPEGIFASIIYLDLVGLTSQEARLALLRGLSESGKPDQVPLSYTFWFGHKFNFLRRTLSLTVCKLISMVATILSIRL